MSSKKDHIETVARDMISEYGLINLTRDGLCDRAGIPAGSFAHIMGCSFNEYIEQVKEVDDVIVTDVTSRRRVNPELRRDQILKVAIGLSKQNGYNNVTRASIAEHAGISTGSVSRYFNTMAQLQRAIMRVALHEEIPEIIAQGLVNGDKHAKKASSYLKELAAAFIRG